MRLYHLSPLELTVLDPAYSQGRENVVWMVKRFKLDWALHHLRQRHGQPMRFLHTLHVPRSNLLFRWDGVFTCADCVRVYKVIPIEEFSYVGKR